MGTPEGKGPSGRRRHRWEDNIKMNLQVVGWENVNCIDVAPDSGRWRALVNALSEPSGCVKCGEFLD